MTTVTSDMWSDSFSLFKRVPNAGDPNAPKDSPEANGVGLNQQTFMPNSSCRSSDELFVFAGQMLGVSLRSQGFFRGEVSSSILFPAFGASAHQARSGEHRRSSVS